jgi:type 1 fimbriae regulatory protein FimE
LVKTAKSRKYGERDAFMIRFAYAHALRVSELVGMKWTQVDWDNACLYVKRKKNGQDVVHYIDGEELRSLRKLQRQAEGPFIFVSERKSPLSTRAVHYMVAECGKTAGFAFPVHPHMLRHAKGYNLANRQKTTREIQDYLGHSDISSTEIYTRLNVKRFEGFGGHYG